MTDKTAEVTLNKTEVIIYKASLKTADKYA